MAQFNALSGAELKAVFLDTISKALDESGDFGTNLSYPWVKWDFSIKMTSYPKFAVDAELTEVAAGEQEMGEEPDDPGLLDHKEFVSPEPLVIDTPDQARVDADLPLPTPVPIEHVGTVDKLVRQAFKKGK